MDFVMVSKGVHPYYEPGFAGFIDVGVKAEVMGASDRVLVMKAAVKVC